ncbi:MAG: 2,5-diamino-6-hydroxy-4-(5-phosphoribosylamino)pyrimidine 1''-reductase, archaeal [halophilic archaeon J07HX5]|nr:MAG: 2,5-diamino-6-hydroxy-4-(5-phosphoribosylamino)pyrimidine 1''-reductase, archaeal [halophilic archaeon J07HX5]
MTDQTGRRGESATQSGTDGQTSTEPEIKHEGGPGSDTETQMRTTTDADDLRVVVNAAVSVDGKLSTQKRTQVAISGDADFDRVDQIRAESDAVMVGVGTVLADDPRLRVKDNGRRMARQDRGEPPHPARIVADSRARTPDDAALFEDHAQTYLLVSEAAPADRVERLRAAGATVFTAGTDRVDLAGGLGQLAATGAEQILVEGGGEIIFSLFEQGLVDRLSVYVGSMVIGGRDAPTLADGEGFVDDLSTLSLQTVNRLGDGVVLTYGVSPKSLLKAEKTIDRD